jgi:hypothetical protein
MNETSEGPMPLSEVYDDEREKVRQTVEKLIAKYGTITSAEVAIVAKVPKRSTASYLDVNWKGWKLVRKKVDEGSNKRWVYAKDATKISLNL